MSILRWGREAKVLGWNMGHVNPAVGRGSEGVRGEYGSDINDFRLRFQHYTQFT